MSTSDVLVHSRGWAVWVILVIPVPLVSLWVASQVLTAIVNAIISLRHAQ